MTQRPSTDAFDLLMREWLEADGRVREPDDLVDAVLTRTRRTRRLPGWLLPERWLTMQHALRFETVPRLVPVVLLIAALLVAAAIALTVGSPARLPAPFGPAVNGVLAYDVNGGIVIADEDGGNSRTIVRGIPNAAAPTFSPNGTKIAFWGDGSPDSLYVGNADGSGVTKVSGDLWIATDKPPAWSPDGRSVAFSAETGPDTHDERVYVVDVGDPTPRALWDDGPRGFYPAWSPDGAWIAFVGVPPSEDVFAIWIVRPDGSGSHPLTATTGTEFAQPQWAPRLRPMSIAFAVASVGGAGNDIHVVDLPSEQARRDADDAGDAGDARFPAWSPDGTKLAWLVGHDPSTLRVATVADQSEAARSLPTGGIEQPIRWSPDGTKVFGANEDKTFISIVTVDGSVAPYRITHSNGQGAIPAWQRKAR